MIITICSSRGSKEENLQAQRYLALQGHIVLSCPFFEDVEFRESLRELHRKKIAMSDAVFIIPNERGSIGESVSEEVEYAVSLGKQVMSNIELGDTVKSILLNFPGFSFDIITPNGFLNLDPHQVDRLLAGEELTLKVGEIISNIKSSDLLSFKVSNLKNIDNVIVVSCSV